jgi:cation transport ATPase
MTGPAGGETPDNALTGSKRLQHKMRSCLQRGILAVAATAVVGLLALLALSSAVWTAAVTASALAPGASLWQAVPPLLVVLGYVLAIAAFVKMVRSRTRRSACLWSAAAVGLVLVASFPSTWTILELFFDEWCETEPGGRGFQGVTALEEIPAVCR